MEGMGDYGDEDDQNRGQMDDDIGFGREYGGGGGQMDDQDAENLVAE